MSSMSFRSGMPGTSGTSGMSGMSGRKRRRDAARRPVGAASRTVARLAIGVVLVAIAASLAFDMVLIAGSALAAHGMPLELEAVLEPARLREIDPGRVAPTLVDTVFFGGSGLGVGEVVRGGVWDWEADSGEPPEFFFDGEAVGNQFRDGWRFEDRTSRTGPRQTGSGHWLPLGFWEFEFEGGSFAHRASFHANDGVDDGPDPLDDPMTPGGVWSIWIGTNLFWNPEHCGWQRTAGYGNGWSQGIAKLFMIDAPPGAPIDLRFYHRYAVEAGFDSCLVEISFDGQLWEPVGSPSLPLGLYSGGDAQNPLPTPFGGEEMIPLLQWPGGVGPLFVRFRMATDAFFSDESDGGQLLHGWQIDGIQLFAAGIPQGFTDFEHPDPSLALDGWQLLRFEGRDFDITFEPNRPAGRIVDLPSLSCATGPTSCLAGNVLVFTDREQCELHDTFQDTYLTSPAFSIGGPENPDIDGWEGRFVTAGVYMDGGAGAFETGLSWCTVYAPFDSLFCPYSPWGGEEFNWSRTDLTTCRFVEQGAGAVCNARLSIDISGVVPARADSVILSVGVFSQCFYTGTCDPDDSGAPFFDDVRFGVYHTIENQPPVCNAGGPYAGSAGQPLLLDGTASFDPDGTIDLYEWDFGDGQLATGPVVEHVYAAPADYLVSLTLTDNQLAVTTCGTVAIIGPPINLPPVCEAGGPYGGEIYQPVDFDGSASFDPDGSIIEYHWDFGDGGVGLGPLVTHVYQVDGQFPVSLLLTDDAGEQTSCGTIADIAGAYSVCIFVDGGVEQFEVGVELTLDLPELGAVSTVPLSGPLAWARTAPPPPGELQSTEIAVDAMDLVGIGCLGPVHVHLSPDPTMPSTGRVQQPEIGFCYPAESFVDLFLVIDMPDAGLVLHNDLPLRVSTAAAHAVPPYGDTHTSETPVPLLDGGGVPVGMLDSATWTPRAERTGLFLETVYEFELYGTPPAPVFLSGPAVACREAPLTVTFPSQPGLWQTRTELEAMYLAGTHPVYGPVALVVDPDRPTLGTLQNPPGLPFPASSSFELYVHLRPLADPDLTVQNIMPIGMSATVDGWPPIGATYTASTTSSVPVERVKTREPGGVTTPGSTDVTGTYPRRDYPTTRAIGYCAACQLALRIGGGSTVMIPGMQAEWVVDRDDPFLRLDGLTSVAQSTPSLQISGFSPEFASDVYVWLNPQAQPSAGEILQEELGPTYPAQSAMDLFLTVYVPGQGLFASNEVPFRVSGSVEDIEFSGQHAGNDPVPLLDPGQDQVATLEGMVLAPEVPFDPSCPASPNCGVTVIAVSDLPGAAPRMRLLPSVPNPFSQSATIRFELAGTAEVEVRVFGVGGRLLRTIGAGRLGSGEHAVEWDGRDDAGRAVASGIYLYAVTAAAGEATGRLVLIR